MVLNKSKCFLTLLVIFLVFNLICVNFASGQTNDESERTITLTIYVLSIDTSVRNANVTIHAKLFSRTWLDMKYIILGVYGGGELVLNCTGNGNNYSGYGTAIWRPYGNSISYPYDAYGLRFELIIHSTETKFRIDENDCKVSFYGPERDALESVWKMGEIHQLESPSIGIVKTFSRIESWSILIQTMLLSMYLLFAGSFFLKLSDLKSRLTVYFTIAAFSLSFLVFLQTNLPWRPFYTLPEFLIIILISIVAFAGFFTMIGTGFRLIGFFELVPDLATSLSSLAFWYFLFFAYAQALLTPQALNMLRLVYIVYTFGSLTPIIFRAVRYWRDEKRRKQEEDKPIHYIS